MWMEVVSQSAKETKNLAAQEAAKIMAAPLGEHAAVIALEGELGAGKTTFVQGFAHALGVTDVVRSPTFLLMKKYPLKKRNLYHIDCYRLNSSKDLIALEIDSILKDSKNIVLIEWSERAADILPRERITIHLDHISEHERKVTIS